MRRVRCPRCKAIVHARGDEVRCASCGLQGRVDAPAKAATEKDPWQITLDLRKLNPGNWGPGARSFAMFLLFVGVFVAGGASGIVFERNRDEGGGDLASAADFFAAKPAAGPATDPATTVEDPVPEDVVLAADSITLNDGSDLSQPVTLDNRLLRLRMEYHGDRSFSVRLSPLDPDARSVTVTATEPGDYDTVRYVAVDAVGEYTVEVRNIDAADTWSVTIEQPGGEAAPAGTTKWSGRGDLGKGPLTLDGQHTLTFTPGKAVAGSFFINVYSEAGERLTCSFFGDKEKSDTCAVDGPVKAYFDIVSKTASSDDTWQLVVD